MRLVETSSLPSCGPGQHELEAGIEAITGHETFTCVECGAVFEEVDP